MIFDDHPHEECGVIGIFAPNEDVARMTFFGLYALQHRGQEAAGIAVADGQSISIHKGVGLVSQVFTANTMAELKGHYAIGHTRYSTTGSSLLRNAQPWPGAASRSRSTTSAPATRRWPTYAGCRSTS